MGGERRIVFRKVTTEKLHGKLLQGWRISKKKYNNQYPITKFLTSNFRLFLTLR